MNANQGMVIVSTALTMGGVERSSLNLANSLVAKGIEVTFISILKKEHFFELDYRVKLIEPVGFNQNKISLLRTIYWLRNNFKANSAEIVFSYTKFYSALVAIALTGLRKKHFISERSSPLYKWPIKIEIISKLAFKIRTPYGVISQTKVASQEHKKYYAKVPKYHVIHNPVKHVELFPEVERRKRVIAIGRLDDQSKRFGQLLKTFSEIDNSWSLVLAGGVNNSNIPQLIDQLELSNRVELPGKVKSLDRMMAECSIFVITSKTEGFPNALCEAMAAGLACVSFDFMAGPRDIITHKQDGIIIEDGDFSKLKKTLVNLMENREERERLGGNALSIREKLHQDKIAQQFISCFNLG